MASTQKRRTVGETLNGTPSTNRLAQFNILGASNGNSTISDQTKDENPSKAPPQPKIIEISEDGSFEIPNEPAEPDEPPELDLLSSLSSVKITPAPAPVTEQPEVDEGPSVMDEMMTAANAARQVVKEKAAAEEKRVKKEFGGGLKKGFFNSGGPKTKSKAKKQTTKTTTTIETVKPTAPKPTEKKNEFVLNEVQEAMKSSASPMSKLLADGEWMTPDLLQTFATNPKLAKGLSDPRFQAAITEMQKDPKAAMAKFQNDKELSEFLTEFFNAMGNHFSKIGEKTQAPPEKVKPSPKQPPISETQPKVERPLSDAAMKKAAETAATPVSKQEQEQMNQILQNEKLRELLMDPEMQRVMMDCAQPGRLQYYVQDPKWGPKIRLLADNGLVRVER